MHKVKEIINRFLKGDEREAKAKKNIIASFLLKGISIVIGFLLVRVTLNYLDQTRYGIWLTLTSLITWVTFFDLGLGNGLRNKLAEAIAVKDYELGKIYVSTTYAIIMIIMVLVSIVFLIVNRFIDWTVILNTDKSLGPELSMVAMIVFNLFFFRMVLQLIGVILLSDQRPAMSSLFVSVGNILSLIVIFGLKYITKGSLISFSLAMSGIPIIILGMVTIYFFKKDYSLFKPSIAHIRFKYGHSLLSLGIKFFLIQISGLILYQSSNIIITQFFGPIEVIPYNIAYKYFSLITMVLSIILIPFWTAFTDAWAKGDIIWIKNTVNKLLKYWLALSTLGVFFLIGSNKFYSIWLGNKVTVPFSLSVVTFIYFVTMAFTQIFTMFINGVGKIQLQLILSFISAILFIPLAYIFIKYCHLGIEGIVLASIIGNIEGFVFAPIQYYKIINNKAVGVWNK
jgi:O-antigen/teichoic acid export membrane protein